MINLASAGSILSPSTTVIVTQRHSAAGTMALATLSLSFRYTTNPTCISRSLSSPEEFLGQSRSGLAWISRDFRPKNLKPRFYLKLLYSCNNTTLSGREGQAQSSTKIQPQASSRPLIIVTLLQYPTVMFMIFETRSNENLNPSVLQSL